MSRAHPGMRHVSVAIYTPPGFFAAASDFLLWARARGWTDEQVRDFYRRGRARSPHIRREYHEFYPGRVQGPERGPQGAA